MSAFYGNADQWREDAACKGWPVILFHPVRQTGGQPTNYTQAVRDVCATCPVRQPCLDDALHGEAHLGHPVMGYRGGHTPEQRLVMLREAALQRRKQRRRLLTAARTSGVPAARLADAYGVTVRTVVRATAAQ